LKFNEAATASCASRGNISIEYGVPMRSLSLGLLGKVDAAECHRMVDGACTVSGKEEIDFNIYVIYNIYK